MTTALAVPTESHFPVVKELPDFETWKQDGAARFRRYETAESSLELIQWDIGDWLVEGLKFGDRAYEEAKQITDWELETLYNVVWVTKKFPISLRSETKLKWSHFKELARIKTKDVREEVLRQLNDGYEHTVLEVRERVDRTVKDIEREQEREPEPERKGPPLVSMQVLLKPEVRDTIKAYAKAKHKQADEVLGEIVMAYVKRNKKRFEVGRRKRAAKETEAKTKSQKSRPSKGR